MSASPSRISPWSRHSHATCCVPRHGFRVVRHSNLSWMISRSSWDIFTGFPVRFGMPTRKAAARHTGLTGPAPLARARWRARVDDRSGRAFRAAGGIGGRRLGSGRHEGRRVNLEGLRLDAHRIGVDISDPDNRFPAAYGISKQGATLLRPDGFVGWRSVGASSNAELDLSSEALRHCPCLSTGLSCPTHIGIVCAQYS